jgi:hypothetical protein
MNLMRLFWHSYLLNPLKRKTMNTKQDEYPEPPELRKQNIPPLKKVVKYFVIGLIIAFIIAAIFGLIFYFRNN